MSSGPERYRLPPGYVARDQPLVVDEHERQRDLLGPPPNREHAREWTLAEFNAFLVDGGFPRAELQLVGVPVRRTILAVVRGS